MYTKHGYLGEREVCYLIEFMRIETDETLCDIFGTSDIETIIANNDNSPRLMYEAVMKYIREERKKRMKNL